MTKFPRVEFDESYAYCATVYYSQKVGYQVKYHGQRNDFDSISDGCARACFKDRRAATGLTFLEIETQTGYSDKIQAYAAGLIEGSLTWMSIYAQWRNTIESFCEKSKENEIFCKWLRDVVEVNFENVQNLAEDQRTNDPYHHQIFLFYHQLQGIEAGFNRGTKRALGRGAADVEIPFTDFLLLNARVDIEDLKLYYNEFVIDFDYEKVDVNPRVGKMVLKVAVENDGPPKILVGHTSDGEYTSMLKMVKTYRFNYHHGPETSRLAINTDITFTSYPGSIASSDDFYLATGKHTRLIIAGVAAKQDNVDLLHGIDLVGTIFSSARVMAANRLSYNGKNWSRVMARDPHIGAKQWLVIDERRMKYFTIDSENYEIVTSPTVTLDGDVKQNEVPTDIIPSADQVKSHSNRNLIWLVDQTYRRLHAEDVTTRFKIDGDAWLLDGTPYFKVIQELNELKAKDIKVGRNFSSLDEIMDLFKSNAHRGDLSASPSTFGNIDVKLYASENHQLLVQNGPVSHNSSQPFDWDSDDFSDIRHDEHPSLWDFEPVQVQFLWN